MFKTKKENYENKQQEFVKAAVDEFVTEDQRSIKGLS
jgi:hypothetical protein